MSFNIAAFNAAKSADSVLGRKLIHQAAVDSTMTLAKHALFGADNKPDLPMEQVAEAWHGAVFVSDEQTAGKGRRGRAWLSNVGNLYFTLAYVHESSSQMFDTAVKLNFATPLAVVEELRALGVANAVTKWPNDCWVNGRKICGMLIDNEHQVSFVGVGVNLIDNFESGEGESGQATVAAIATSVTRELSAQAAPIQREVVLAGVLRRLDEAMRGDLDTILKRYSSVHMLSDAVVRVHHKTREETDERDYDAQVLGLSKHGMLRVRRVDTAEEKQLSGEEVSIRPNPTQ